MKLWSVVEFDGEVRREGRGEKNEGCENLDLLAWICTTNSNEEQAVDTNNK